MRTIVLLFILLLMLPTASAHIPYIAGPETSARNPIEIEDIHLSQVWYFEQETSDSDELPYESGLLKLNCDKALTYLHWQAVLPFKETVSMTADWYRTYYEDSSKILEVTLSQIKEYKSYIINKEMMWIH